jgi:pimeloyl-ACP methyl ester carboxylesterase
MNVRMFASLYPVEVVGMILVDSSYPHQQQRFSPRTSQITASFYREFDMHALTMPIGIARLMGWCGTDPPEFRSMVRAVECRRQFFREVHEEYAGFISEDGDQLRVTAPLGNMPLVVLSHDPDWLMPGYPVDVSRDFEKAWEPMQLELARLSTNSSRVIAKGSSHYIQIDKPDLVIEAVQKVVDQCRTAQLPASQP